MIISFIIGKPRPEIYTLSRARLSEHEGDGLTVLGNCCVTKNPMMWKGTPYAHIMGFFVPSKASELRGNRFAQHTDTDEQQ